MSYIIAFVRFTEPGRTYPVACFRTDIDGGDEVLVQLRNRELKPAIVVQIRFHNWSCTGAISGKVSEAVIREDGSWDLQKPPPSSASQTTRPSWLSSSALGGCS